MILKKSNKIRDGVLFTQVMSFKFHLSGTLIE